MKEITSEPIERTIVQGVVILDDIRQELIKLNSKKSCDKYLPLIISAVALSVALIR